MDSDPTFRLNPSHYKARPKIYKKINFQEKNNDFFLFTKNFGLRFQNLDLPPDLPIPANQS
jgi:hypothetical protein